LTGNVQHFKFIQDKLALYLDITETHISKQISTKANTFFHAMTSQDEVREHVLKTLSAVKNLRKNINSLDADVVLTSIKILKQINIKMRYKLLIEKLELMSTIYKTQPTIQFHLASSEYTGALDLISMSQEILRQDLRGIRALRHYDSQFIEIEKVIDKMLHQEFIKYICSDLGRPFSDGHQILNEEKLYSLMLGVLRVKQSPFIDLFKDEIFIYMKSTIKQTLIEYISQLDDHQMNKNNNEETDVNSNKLIDQVKHLKIQEFLHLLTKILTNVKVMLKRVESIISVISNVINNTTSSIKLKDKSPNNEPELVSPSLNLKLSNSLTELQLTACDYTQERLANLLENKFKENIMDRLNSNDFISLTSLIDQFVVDIDVIVNKKTSCLRSWLQNQANKFIQKYHQERKEKLTLILEAERWKQTDISNDFQQMVDTLLKNGLAFTSPSSPSSTTLIKKIDPKSKETNPFLTVNNEQFILFGSALYLIRLINEYAQLVNDMPHLCFDIMTRLIECLKIFNSRFYQMILGVGAVQTGVLRVITFKTIAITYRSLELILIFIELTKEFFNNRLATTNKSNSSNKQLDQITKVILNLNLFKIYNL
jgi:vacuolar protein sorting-associated protein 54